MKRLSHLLALTTFFFSLLFFLSQTSGDLKSDKQALLNFAASVPHSRKLNWTSNTRLCTSWIGITCSTDGSRVLALRLPAVGLYGPVPLNTIGKLDALITVSLRSNHLTGNLPPDVLSLPSLRYIYLQRNNFSGGIPSSFSPNLKALDLSFNSLTGDIPSTLQNLTQLASLSLQNNSLTGPIPAALNVTELKQLNLSYNQLNGSIPSFLQNFPTSSFEGNNGLCGPPLLSRCSNFAPSPSPSPCPTPSSSPAPSSMGVPQNPGGVSKKKLSGGSVVAIAVGGCVVLLFLTVVALVCCLKKKDKGEGNNAVKGKGGRVEKPKDFGSGVQEAEKNKLVFFEGCSYSFDLEDLLRASAEVLGKGRYGTTYKAILEEGTTVAVKRLKEVAVGKREFEQQMESVGRMGQHPNIVPLRAYYYSKDEKLLVYDYMAAGSFSASLHGNDNYPMIVRHRPWLFLLFFLSF